MKHFQTTIRILISIIWVLILLQSCSHLGRKDLVEFWKPAIAPDVESLQIDIVKSRFDLMVSEPNEYQMAYLELATEIVKHMSFGQETSESGDELENHIKEQIDSRVCSCDASIVANYQSHPQLYVENVCKLIEPIEELWDLSRARVTAIRQKKIKVHDLDAWLVLYQIDHAKGADSYTYKICSILDLGEHDGYEESEFTVGETYYRHSDAIKEWAKLEWACKNGIIDLVELLKS